MSIYVPYSRRELINEPRVVFLGRYRVEFKAFGLAEYMYSTPVVIIAGDFQKFSHYREFVLTLQNHRPVVIVSLPSCGGNDQRVANLSLDEMAGILKSFLEHFDFPKVSLISMSLGGWVASRFCCLYPERVHRLLLAGIARKPRKSFCMTLEESVSILSESTENFADAMILHLFHPRFWGGDSVGGESSAEVISGVSYRKLFRRQIGQLSALEKRCYQDNVQRLLSDRQTDSLPAVKTLVLAGQYDHFTLPFESAEYAQACLDAEFVLIKGADHLIQYECMGAVLDCIVQFLAGRSLAGVAGIAVGEDAIQMSLNKRTSPRLMPKKSKARLLSGSSGLTQNVLVRDVNYRGGVLELSDQALSFLSEEKDLELLFPDMDLKFKVVIFDIDVRCVKFLFKHIDIGQAATFVHTLSDPKYFIKRKKKKALPDSDDYCTGEESLAN